MKARLHSLILILPLLVWGCSRERAGFFQGYVEGEYVYVASPVAGELKELWVARGDAVQPDQRLFALDPEPESSALQVAEQRLVQATARLANLTKGLRPTELAALEARLASAEADADLAQSEWARFKQLQQERVVSPEEMDRAQTRRAAARATVASLQAELETARLGAREDEIAAARAELEALKATRDQVRWAVDQKQQSAPGASVVDDTLYRVGEWVAAGRPVVTLLPPENVKVRFFVPEPELASIQVGARVTVSYDGAAGRMPATVSYISTQVEFTPPVIFSQDNRAKLVYMVEARFASDADCNLHPGQPVDVRRIQ